MKPQPRSGLHAAKRMPTPTLSGMIRTSEPSVSPALASLAPRILMASHLFCWLLWTSDGTIWLQACRYTDVSSKFSVSYVVDIRMGTNHSQGELHRESWGCYFPVLSFLPCRWASWESASSMTLSQEINIVGMGFNIKCLCQTAFCILQCLLYKLYSIYMLYNLLYILYYYIDGRHGMDSSLSESLHSVTAIVRIRFYFLW